MAIIVVIRIKPEVSMVFLRLLGFRKPKSFHVIPLTFILQEATIKVVNDQKRPFIINPTFGMYSSLTKNITAIYNTKSTKNPVCLIGFNTSVLVFRLVILG